MCKNCEAKLSNVELAKLAVSAISTPRGRIAFERWYKEEYQSRIKRNAEVKYHGK